MNLYRNLAQNVINDFNLGSSVYSMQSRKYTKAFARRAARKFGASRRSRDSFITARRSEKQIKRIAQRDVERKRFNTNVAQFSVGTGGSVCLNTVAAGDDSNSRDGRQITMKGLSCSVGVAPVGTEVTYGWWAIVLDRDPQGTSPTVDSIYGGNSTDPAFVGRNPSYIDRFKVLKRCDFQVGSVSSGQFGYWREYIDLESVLTEKEARVRFTSTSGSVAAVNTNALYWVYGISNQSAFGASVDVPAMTMESQLVFID